MSPLAKSTILSLSLLAGAAASAYAQSENIAKLPPSAAVTRPRPPPLWPRPPCSWAPIRAPLGQRAKLTPGPSSPHRSSSAPFPGMEWVPTSNNRLRLTAGRSQHVLVAICNLTHCGSRSRFRWLPPAAARFEPACHAFG